MSLEPPNSPKKVADITGESEEFVLPKAPPVLLPKRSRPSTPARLEDQSLPSAEEESRDHTPAPAVSASPQDRRPMAPPRQRHESPVQQIRLERPPRAEARERDEKSPAKTSHDSELWRNEYIGVILVLLFVIVVLLVSMTGNESPQPTSTNAEVSPSKGNEVRVNQLQSANETMRRQLVEMTAQIEQLKGQLETLHDAREDAVSDLGRATSASDKELAGLRAEVARLETLVRGSKPAQQTTAAVVREPPPEPQVEGKAYRVIGLAEGDTLNVRSGPGSGFSVVTQLPLGVRVIVTGEAVPNGADWWLPCYLRGRVPDPATGASKPWAAKGWIHSAFLEEDG